MFRTELKPPAQPLFDITHQTPVLTIGSCFAENMAARLESLQFPILSNPFGIIYNPISIADCLNYLMIEDGFSEENLFFHNHLWHSWRHHGKFSDSDKNTLLESVNQTLETARLFFKKAKWVMLTLGTAHVYVEKKSNQVVANCHKAPPQYFEKKRLTPDAVFDNLKEKINEIFTQNADCQIIISVSPIRHLRDGLVENNRSKAALLLAVDALSAYFERVHYFPAYELVMDDLRDYRFFEPDMMHPSRQAIDYVWQYFVQTFFSKNTRDLVQEIEKINTMRAHRPMKMDTPQYQQFAHSLKVKTDDLTTRFPFLSF